VYSKLLIFLLFCFVSLGDIAAQDFYKIGVLAYKGKDQAEQTWNEHARYLNRVLFPLNFSIVPLSYKNEELTNAVRNKQIDFVITNPGQYTELELEGLVTHLATRRLKGPKGVLDVFGGTALTLPDRQELAAYRDLHGLKIAIPSRHSLGGWQVHLREALEQGVDLEADNQITELKDHTRVIESVLAGEADVGFVRSDLLEFLESRGSIDSRVLKIINRQDYANYPYLVSTRLYPEWPFAMLTNVPKETASLVLKALLGMHSSEKAAQDAGIEGWTIPGNYSTVNNLFRITGLGPYKKNPITPFDVLKIYWKEILLGALFVYSLLMWFKYRTQKAEFALQKEQVSRQNAEDSIKKQAEMLAQVSHEFRTPLHSIYSFASLALKKADDEKLIKFLNNIKTSSTRSVNLVNSLLDLSKLEAGKMECHPDRADLCISIKAALEEVAALASEKEITLANHCKAEHVTVYDANLILRVLVNLLSNAIKFTPDGGLVKVSVVEDDNYLKVIIKDNGPGIPDDQLQTIFNKFVRGTQTLHQPGTGLGLSICREIIELHDGRIWAESPPPNEVIGSVFYFIIPLK
jgi:signal transduction histidine kinase/ABC-type phosphate/phosphonate transport system substrate-binding protein